MIAPRVLVAEDEQIVALDLRGILEQFGYEVIGCAATGEQAVEMAQRERPDLIVMDVGLEGSIDGPDAAARIREHYDVPIVFVTAFSDEKTLQRAKAGDPFGYILKPFDERELRVTLDMALFKHRATRELRLHHAILENATDGMLILDPSQPARPVVYASPSFFRLTGYSREEVLGRPLATLLWPDLSGPDVEEACAAIENLRKFRKTILSQKKDKSTFWNQLRIEPHWEETGKLVHLVVIQTDVTDQKRVEHHLRESEAHLREAQRVAELGNWSVDLENGRVTWSDQMYHILDVPRDVQPDLDLLLGRIHPEDRQAVQKVIEETNRSSAKSYPLEYRILLPSGEERRVFEFVRVERDPSGNPTRRFGTTQNVTRERRLDEERKRLELQVQHAQKLESLGVLAGGIAHDFNNLLTGMLGYADLALTDLSPASPAREHLEQIVLCARRAAELTRQMLAYSGKGRFVVQPVNLSEVVADMSHLLEVSVSKQCVLRFRFAPMLPYVEADVGQLRQVVMNLIINGSEAIGERSGVIAVGTGVMDCDRSYLAESYLDESLPEGQYVYLEVADSGVGMNEDTRRKIFDPFFTTKFTGRGLGLAAVLGIVRGHRGAIKVYSELGRGTTIKVLFPISTRHSAGQGSRPQEPPPWQGRGIILVVDDEDTVRSMAGSMLRKMGFTTLFASTGVEALQVFRGNMEEIRMVILDLTMPQMDGEEAFRELRRIKPDVRVVLSSGYNEQDVTNRFAGKGLAGFIQKPYRMDELQNTVRRVLEPSDN